MISEVFYDMRRGDKIMKKIIQSVFLAFIFITVLLSGCSPATTPVPPTLTPIPPTFTPIPPTATYTLTATPTSTPIPPTDTPTPIIAQAGATFSGSMAILKSGENASAVSGEIEFITSADGTAIENLSYSLNTGECTYKSEGSTTTITGSSKTTLYFNEAVPITDGEFTLDFMGIRARGNLISPSEATGEITIRKEETIQLPPSVPIKFTCDYGTWTWKASVIR